MRAYLLGIPRPYTAWQSNMDMISHTVVSRVRLPLFGLLLRVKIWGAKLSIKFVSHNISGTFSRATAMLS